ncbi:hypothetical protein GQ53DRAFT_439075 [Thozetella sp. PMI_491]|nr:hypothetical protein GQ53DRAFT_439075 [Thozetella sp. PMI_491]
MENRASGDAAQAVSASPWHSATVRGGEVPSGHEETACDHRPAPCLIRKEPTDPAHQPIRKGAWRFSATSSKVSSKDGAEEGKIIPKHTWRLGSEFHQLARLFLSRDRIEDRNATCGYLGFIQTIFKVSPIDTNVMCADPNTQSPKQKRVLCTQALTLSRQPGLTPAQVQAHLWIAAHAL